VITSIKDEEPEMMNNLKFSVVTLLLAVVVAGLAWVSNAKGSPQASAVGAGRIGNPIPGETLQSPSDFGFAVDNEGGTFVCSMAGPETGGFAGFQVMLVEGPVDAGTLQARGRDVKFSGKATVALIPGLGGASHSVLENVDFTVTARTGKEGKGRMILEIPAFTGPLGGNTGGIIAQGEISVGGSN
jgi:hypothetical protein